MSRFIVWVFIAGLAMLLIGLITAASPVGAALVIVGCMLLAALPFAIHAKARRSHGWTRVWNPGAARREAAAEREARERDGCKAAAE